MNKAFLAKKREYLSEVHNMRSYMAQQRKEMLDKQNHKQKLIHNERWNEYKKQRSLAIDNYFEKVY